MRKASRLKPICLFSVFSVIFLFLLVGTAKASFTLEDEKKLGKEFFEKMEKDNLIVHDSRVNAFLNQVGNLVLENSPKAPFEFHFFVIKSSAVNAFATPGGYVYVNIGLIDLVEKESELAGVLAHEIAHINARHIASIIEKSKKTTIAALAAILAGAFLGGGGDASAAITTFSMAAVTSMNLKFSREHEEEADRLGLSYLVASGYEGESMLDFLKKMRRYEFYSKNIPSYFLTHPGTDERIRYLDGLVQVRYRIQGKESIIGKLKRIQVYLLFDESNSEQKLELFKRSVEKNPTDIDDLYGLALVQEKLGMSAESIKTYQIALRMSPNDEDIIRGLGIASFLAGRTAEAIKYLSKALSLNRNDENTIVYLGRAYDDSGNTPEALRVLKLLEKLPSIKAEAHYHLAMVYGKSRNAGESHYHFGMFFKQNRKNDNALFHFKAALNYLAIYDPKRRDTEKLIEELGNKKLLKGANRKDQDRDAPPASHNQHQYFPW